DLDNVLSVESFVHLVKGRDEASLEELAPGADELCVEGPEGRFCHELLVPFVREDRRERASSDAGDRPALSLASAASNITRAFAPGSEWLYAKLYTGNATADHVLCAVRPAIDAALGSGAADSWFFIRYADPDWHVRLRL